MEPPYLGPETTTSLQVLRDLLHSGLPQPAMLLGGWAVYFLVQSTWKKSFGEDYFGSRDIDLGFHTPPTASPEEIQRGNLPATIEFLMDKHKFSRHGMYQMARYHETESNALLDPEQTRRLTMHEYYTIIIDLVASHQREDLREIAGFQAFSEPLLELPFSSRLHRIEFQMDGANLSVPAPHVLIGMKLRSLPDRQKDNKSIKDLCDLYALVSASGIAPRTLRSRIHRALSDAGDVVSHAMESPFIPQAARHLDQDADVLIQALSQLR